MQIQEFKTPSGQENHFFAVMQFEHNGIFFTAAVTEELDFSGEPTFAHQVLLTSQMGTYSFLISYSEDEPYDVEEDNAALNINAAGTIEGQIVPTPTKRLPFLEGPISLIRQELVKMGRVE